MDDLRTFNSREFENNFNNIYPDELELKKENEDPYEASFFEEVHDRKFKTKLFGKRDAFLFILVTFPIWAVTNRLKYFCLGPFKTFMYCNDNGRSN